MPQYHLGRLENPEDPRDQNYRMASFAPLAERIELPRSKLWRGGVQRLNQMATGHCVGFAGAAWMQCWPTYTRVTNQTGHDLYAAAKAIPGEPWPGIEGTSSRFLMQVLQAQGRIDRYLWAQTPGEINDWVRGVGPVLVGIRWMENMFNPRADHTLDCSGPVVGGHEILIRGYDHRHDQYRLRNSWSSAWGDKGEAWISAIDLYRLLFEVGGDALGIVEIRPPA